MPETNVLPSQLMNSVMGKLYDALTNGDNTAPRSEDNFFSWCTPGIPVQASDFDFLSQGLRGVVKKEAAQNLVTAGGSPTDGTAPALTPEQLTALATDDTHKLYMQAENFARLVDFIPDASGINQQGNRLNVQNDEGTLSEMYERVLRMSQVAETTLPDDVKKKIEKLNGLLTVTKKTKDIITDEEVEVTEPSPLVKAYSDKMKAYNDAVLSYNNARIDALSANDPRAVHFWAMNADTLRNNVRAAMSDWITAGRKDDYEKIAAFIAQVQQRDLTLLKASYVDALQKAKLTGISSGQDFYFSSLVPGNFAQASGWTRFSFSSSHYDSYARSSHNQWGGSAGVSFGLFSFGASAGGSHTSYNSNVNASSFGLSFSMTQVPIVRPWFKAQFLNSKSWRFDVNNVDTKGDILSDGNLPPSRESMMPAYPTSILFVKDLTLSFSQSSGAYSYVRDTVKAGGSVGFGPFTIGGKYSSDKSTVQASFDDARQGMSIPGMQIIGYRCHLLPKSPNPDPGITKWV